jgi:two-component system, NarL family, invasion response regulator UvrY
MTRVLVIDDSDALRGAVRAALAATMPDVTVGEAAGALPGLALVGGERWDAVLLDLSLPDRGGIETLRDIRRLRPGLPVVVMSFHAESEYGDAVRAAGAAGYVAKGSDVGVLAAVLRGVLGGAPAQGNGVGTAPSFSSRAEPGTLARALHDGLGQTLVAAKLDLHLATTASDPDEARRRTTRALALVDEALASVRDLMARFSDGGAR